MDAGHYLQPLTGCKDGRQLATLFGHSARRLPEVGLIAAAAVKPLLLFEKIVKWVQDTIFVQFVFQFLIFWSHRSMEDRFLHLTIGRPIQAIPRS